MNKSIVVHNSNNLPTVPYTKLEDFQGDLKTITQDSLNKLMQSIIEHGVFVSKKVWIDPEGHYWILDGHQTKLALSALEKDGWIIPEIPIEPIEAEDEADAVRKLLQIVSEYGKVNTRAKWLGKMDFDVTDLEHYEVPSLDQAWIQEYSQLPIDLNDDVRKGLGVEPPGEESYDEKRERKIKEKVENIGYKPKIGDIWFLADQVLVCSDSTIESLRLDLVSRISNKFNFSNVDMLFFDPPFQDDLKIQFSILHAMQDWFSHNLIAMTSRKVLAEMKIAENFELNYSHDLVWDRVNPHLGANLNRPLMYHVPIDIYSKKSVNKKIFNRHNEAVDRVFSLDRIPSVLRIADQKRHDPLLDRGAKPLKLMEVLFSTYSDIRIIDCCCGNGVSLVAGHKTRRQVLGIEIDPNLVAISLEYFKRETGIEPTLFGNLNE